MTDQINEAVIKIDEQLKPFQAASVKYVLDQFYTKKRNKVLIADEVGLGKTIIAKGVIAKATQSHKKTDQPFHVVYICSNQVLAYQNINKLNPFGKGSDPLSRLIFLAKNNKENNVESPLRLSSLTPNTSFNITNSVGVKEERAIIYSLLFEYADFYNYRKAWRRLMKGNNQIGKDTWGDETNWYSKNANEVLRSDLFKKFRDRLQSTPYNKERLWRTSNYLDNYQYKSFYHALCALIRKLQTDSRRDALEYSYEIIRVLRMQLTQVCVSYLNADLFILDEFQRFKTLLDGEDQSEAAEIAKAVLHNNESKVLLLSATPFKPFTTNLDQLKGENHHDEFKKIIQFLGGSKGNKLWAEFKKDQEAFFEILRHPQIALKDKGLAQEKRNNLQNTFKKFISRNERISVAKEYNNMTTNDPSDKTDVAHDDVKNFIALDRLVQLLQNHRPGSSNRFGSTLEFSKSAPYPLSFLHGYKIKKYLDDHRNEPEIKEHLKHNKEAWLDYQKINRYEPVGFHKGKPNYPNGKFRVLANECFKNNGEFLLWVPPSKPKYNLFDKYQNTSGFSKILLFSGWAMAPRAIASLISYEVERRTIGSEKIPKGQDKKDHREYFSNSRKPSPRLVFSVKTTDTSTNFNMWMFNLIYPSRSLFEINSFRNFQDLGLTYFVIKNNQGNKIKELFESLEIAEKFENKRKSVDRDWYWISGPLLDLVQFEEEHNTWSDFISSAINSGNGKGVISHISFLKERLDGVISGEIMLGKMPKDLFSVMAEITLSSPANASAFALHNNYSLHYDQNLNMLFRDAYRCAEAFISLFNKPESISAIRISVKAGKEYWKKVLRYSASGSISDLLEEYIYMLKHCNGMDTPDQIADHLNDVLSVRTSSIDVELQKASGEYETHKMRCHFALNYGDQKINTDSGSNRMVNIRSIFNSPFRPFVLASTSVGQEGLDFHFYCRKIFHWNLPHNAIDLEQREGRINRYKGLVIRQKLAEILPKSDLYLNSDKTVWENIFEIAEKSNQDDLTGIKPFWYLDEGEATIERFVPFHIFSKDNKKYEQLKITLALYRLTFGQPRQEELVKALEELNLNENGIVHLRESLLINLSPLKDY
jgi:hypothetical protein